MTDSHHRTTTISGSLDDDEMTTHGRVVTDETPITLDGTPNNDGGTEPINLSLVLELVDGFMEENLKAKKKPLETYLAGIDYHVHTMNRQKRQRALREARNQNMNRSCWYYVEHITPRSQLLYEAQKLPQRSIFFDICHLKYVLEGWVRSNGGSISLQFPTLWRVFNLYWTTINPCKLIC